MPVYEVTFVDTYIYRRSFVVESSDKSGAIIEASCLHNKFHPKSLDELFFLRSNIQEIEEKSNG
jgi:hypothetical protein